MFSMCLNLAHGSARMYFDSVLILQLNFLTHKSEKNHFYSFSSTAKVKNYLDTTCLTGLTSESIKVDFLNSKIV